MMERRTIEELDEDKGLDPSGKSPLLTRRTMLSSLGLAGAALAAGSVIRGALGTSFAAGGPVSGEVYGRKGPPDFLKKDSHEQFVSPEHFDDDIIAAANYAAQHHAILLTNNKVYLVTEEFSVPANLMWMSCNSTIKQTGAASNSATASGIAPQSNVRIWGHLTIDMGSPTAGWGEKCHVRIDSFNNITPEVRGFFFDTIRLVGGHFNCNGFVMAGGASLVRGKRIECGDSAVIGRVFMAHWGNFQQHYNDRGTYRHVAGWEPTTHPHDCIIDEIVAGNMTCNTNDYSAIALISAGYDIEIKHITGNLLDSTISGKALVLLTAGDLAFAYASPAERSHGMKGLTFGKIEGTTSALGVGLLPEALYLGHEDLTNVPSPPAYEDYLSHISLDIDHLDAVGKVEIGVTTNILINGANGRGRTRVKFAKGRYFYSALHVRNLNDNLTIDELAAEDCKINPVVIGGTGADRSKLPKNTAIQKLIVKRYGVTSSTPVYRTALRNELAINTQVNEIIVDEHGNAFCVASTANSTYGHTFKVGSIVVNDASYTNPFLINNTNPINDPVQLDHYYEVAGTVTTGVTGGVSVRTNGRFKEYFAATLYSGLKVNAGDFIYNLGAGDGATVKYFVKIGGVVGSTAILQKVHSKPITLSYTSTELAAGAVVKIRSNATLTGITPGDKLDVTLDQPLQGTRLYAEVTAANTFDVYHENPTSASVTVAGGTMTIQL
ncbi:hypothetical protein [Paenibacillus sp. GCM10012303]|uniref:hypothetical protein n=1 Tax=Paenibacillus sp. GCM10012303 TaxID=3317340 RepID=UPI00360628A7